MATMADNDAQNSVPRPRRRQLNVEFDDADLLKQFKAECKLRDVNQHEVVAALVKGWVSGVFKI